jgi:hypothetical protein
MTSQKFVLGTIVGGVVLFLLGYLAYGLLLADFFAANSTTPMLETPVFWALILGQLGFSALLTYAIATSGVRGVSGGFRVGLVVGLFAVIGFDFTMFATQGGTNLQGTVTDVVVFGILMGIGGAAIGAVATRS